MNRGKIVIVVMVAVGIGLATFAWWHRWRESRSVLANFGGEASAAIRTGEQVELLRLAPATDLPAAAETIAIVGNVYAVTSRRDISRAAGLIHARHHLLNERGFDWTAEPPVTAPSWDYLLRFTKDSSSVATLALAFGPRRMRLLERGQEVSMAPIADALREFIQDLMPDDGAATPAVSPE